MKRLLLWLIGVALGVVVLLAAVLGVSYSFTSEGAKPASEVQFAGQELEPNGWCWQVPLLGGQVDKVFASPRTLTVQKLGVLYDAHPAFALPEWYSYGPLTITDRPSPSPRGAPCRWRNCRKAHRWRSNASP